MITSSRKELETLRATVTRLESEIAAQLNTELAALPARYGFSSTDEFIAAVADAAGVAVRRGRPSQQRPVAASGPKRRRRAKITDAHRTAVKKLVNAGRTGAQIATELGISLPSVQNIKKALGLVKARA